jgi:hypothetical protein
VPKSSQEHADHITQDCVENRPQLLNYLYIQKLQTIGTPLFANIKAFRAKLGVYEQSKEFPMNYAVFSLVSSFERLLE